MQSPRSSWLEHSVPLVSIVIAVALVLLTPFWAVEWSRLPFLGVLLEPSNIVSQIDEAGWPARSAGANRQWRFTASGGLM